MKRLADSVVVPVVVLEKVEDAVPTAKAMAAGNWEKITNLCTNSVPLAIAALRNRFLTEIRIIFAYNS